MSKATPATTSTPARQLSTPDLIARMWDALEWRKTLQIAFIITIAGITIFLVLAGLGLLAHATGLTAGWPVGTSIITATVSYRIAHRKRQ